MREGRWGGPLAGRWRRATGIFLVHGWLVRGSGKIQPFQVLQPREQFQVRQGQGRRRKIQASEASGLFNAAQQLGRYDIVKAAT